MTARVQFNHPSIAVWVSLALLLFGSSCRALGDDDHDDLPAHRSNHTHSSGFIRNQADRFPINSNNNNNDPSQLFRFSPFSQFGSPFQSVMAGGMAFPLNSAAFQQNGSPQLGNFQQNGFQQSSLPQNGFQQPGFSANNFRQNGLQQGFRQQQNVGLGQANQFSSLGLQSQLGPNVGLQNQLSSNSFKNQLGLQNPFAFSQNPVELGLLQQSQLGLQNQFALQNQFGVQNQLAIQNPFQLQNQLGFQNPLRIQQQNPFSFSQQLGSPGVNNKLLVSQFGLNNPQLTSSNMGFRQPNLGLASLPQNNGGALFSTTGIGSGSSSARPIGSNQDLLQGGQFQESPSLSGFTFGGESRFPSGAVTNNRFPNNGAGLGGSQFDSQFGSQLNSDPFLSQRLQFQSSVDNRQPNEQVRNSGFSSNERALSFNDSFELTSQFQPIEQQRGQQPKNNPFLFQHQFAMFNNRPLDDISIPFTHNQQPIRTQFHAFPLALDQQLQHQQGQQLQHQQDQQMQHQQDQQRQHQQGQHLIGSQNEVSAVNSRPVGQFKNLPFNDDDDDDGKSLFNHQITQTLEQQSLPLAIAVTGFSCDGRPPGYYADVKNECRTFHICIDDGSTSGMKRSFACPNGTLFDQVNSVCQWKESMDCSKSHLFYPRRAASTASGTTASNTQRRPTMSPMNSQIPSPVHNFPISTQPSNLMSLGLGQPSPAMGSLDAGRSLEDTRRKADNREVRTRSTLYAPPQIRPPLFRPSERLDDMQKAA